MKGRSRVGGVVGTKWSQVLLSHRKVRMAGGVQKHQAGQTACQQRLAERPSPQVLLGKEEAGKLAF